MALMPDARKNKAEVNYRMHEKCATCMHFYYPNSCEKVDGNVSGEAVCKLWALKPPEEPKDGQFYQQEYNKTKA